MACLLNAVSAQPQRWLVRLPANKQTSLSAGELAHLRPFRHIPWGVLETTQTAVIERFKALASAGELQMEPDQPIALAALPNDPLLDLQAFITPDNPDADIHLAQAWDLQTSATSVVVAVIDSGVDATHPDLAANMWINTIESSGTPGLDDDGNGYVDDIRGWNTVDNNDDITDTLFHGTHVTGILAAVGNNGVGIAGVCWRARVLQVRAFKPPDASELSDALEGMDYLFSNPQVRAVNASWGVTTNSQALLDTLQIARQKNILVVAASGNRSKDLADEPFFPAAIKQDNIITVGGIQEDGGLWRGGTDFGSNYGLAVDLMAPSNPVLSTRIGGVYLSDGGTSYAAPHVLGAAALLWAREPDLTAAQMRERLISTCRWTNALAPEVLGGGLLDVKALLQAPTAAAAWSAYQ